VDEVTRNLWRVGSGAAGAWGRSARRMLAGDLCGGAKKAAASVEGDARNRPRLA
jgi:hypothetical protein